MAAQGSLAVRGLTSPVSVVTTPYVSYAGSSLTSSSTGGGASYINSSSLLPVPTSSEGASIHKNFQTGFDGLTMDGSPSAGYPESSSLESITSLGVAGIG